MTEMENTFDDLVGKVCVRIAALKPPPPHASPFTISQLFDSDQTNSIYFRRKPAVAEALRNIFEDVKLPSQDYPYRFTQTISDAESRVLTKTEFTYYFNKAYKLPTGNKSVGIIRLDEKKTIHKLILLLRRALDEEGVTATAATEEAHPAPSSTDPAVHHLSIQIASLQSRVAVISNDVDELKDNIGLTDRKRKKGGRSEGDEGFAPVAPISAETGDDWTNQIGFDDNMLDDMSLMSGMSPITIESSFSSQISGEQYSSIVNQKFPQRQYNLTYTPKSIEIDGIPNFVNSIAIELQLKIKGSPQENKKKAVADVFDKVLLLLYPHDLLGQSPSDSMSVCSAASSSGSAVRNRVEVLIRRDFQISVDTEISSVAPFVAVLTMSRLKLSETGEPKSNKKAAKHSAAKKFMEKYAPLFDDKCESYNIYLPPV